MRQDNPNRPATTYGLRELCFAFVHVNVQNKKTPLQVLLLFFSLLGTDLYVTICHGYLRKVVLKNDNRVGAL